ncbi:MAG: preprotein translocase subunit YajC [Methylococcaceae bacterium]
MSFFISEAIAEAAPAEVTQDPGIVGIILPLAILLFFYVLFIRPQAKRSKEHKKMVETLGKGAEVVTNGGILGKVIDIDENFVKLDVGDSLSLLVQRNAIGNVMPKGTYKAAFKKEKKTT